MNFNFCFLGQQFSANGLLGRAQVPVSDVDAQEFIELAHKLDEAALAVIDENGATTEPVCSRRPLKGVFTGKDAFVVALQALGEMTGWRPQFLPSHDSTDTYYVRLSTV